MKNDQSLTTLLAGEATFLAAERTYSAWIRTGLAGLAAGLGIMKFVEFKTPLHTLLAHSAGILLLVWGTLIFAFAFTQYRHITRKLFQNYGTLINPWQINTLTSILFIIVLLVVLIIST